MNTKTIYPGERQAVAIKQANKAAEALSHASDLLADNLANLEKELPVICATDDSPDLQHILDRITRLCQLRNEMELGSFKLAVSKSLDAAFQRLP